MTPAIRLLKRTQNKIYELKADQLSTIKVPMIYGPEPECITIRDKMNKAMSLWECLHVMKEHLKELSKDNPRTHKAIENDTNENGEKNENCNKVDDSSICGQNVEEIIHSVDKSQPLVDCDKHNIHNSNHVDDAISPKKRRKRDHFTDEEQSWEPEKKKE